MASNDQPDISLLRTPIYLQNSDVLQIVQNMKDGTQEVRSALLQECKIIFECKICCSLFRSMVNFLAHKRVYCKEKHESRPVMFRDLNLDLETIMVEPEMPEARKPSDIYQQVEKTLREKHDAKKEVVIELRRIDGNTNAMMQTVKGEGCSEDVLPSQYDTKEGEVVSVQPQDAKGHLFMNLRCKEGSTATPDRDDKSAGFTASCKKLGAYYREIVGQVSFCDMERLKCKKCDSSFMSFKGLKKHMLRHVEGLKGYKCTKCKSGFQVMSNLLKHVSAEHNYSKPQVEGLRARLAIKDNDLRLLSKNLHRSKSSPMKNEQIPRIAFSPVFETPVKPAEKAATLSFPDPGDFPRFKCSVCSKRFFIEEQTRKHIRKIHIHMLTRYKCSLCSFSLIKMCNLRRHMMLVHKIPEKKFDPSKVQITKGCSVDSLFEKTRYNIQKEEVIARKDSENCEASKMECDDSNKVVMSVDDEPAPQNTQIQQNNGCTPDGKTNHVSSVKSESEQRSESIERRERIARREKQKKLYLSPTSSSPQSKEGFQLNSCPNCNRAFGRKEAFVKHLDICDTEVFFRGQGPNGYDDGDEDLQQEETPPVTCSEQIEQKSTDAKQSVSTRAGKMENTDSGETLNRGDGEADDKDDVIEKDTECSDGGSLKENLTRECEGLAGNTAGNMEKFQKQLYSLRSDSRHKMSPKESEAINKIVDEKNLKCLKCGTIFKDASSLHRHAVRHMGWRRFKCKFCNAAATYYKSECEQHLRRIHPAKTAGHTDLNAFIMIVNPEKFVPEKSHQSRVDLRRQKFGKNTRTMSLSPVRANGLRTENSPSPSNRISRSLRRRNSADSALSNEQQDASDSSCERNGSKTSGQNSLKGSSQNSVAGATPKSSPVADASPLPNKRKRHSQVVLYGKRKKTLASDAGDVIVIQ